MRSLLAAWQRTRSAELATVIAAHSRASESVAARALRERSKIPQGEWLKLAAGLGVIDRGALLASLAGATSGQVTERVEALDAWDPDPRVSDALHDMIRQLPWVSTGSRKVWTRTFKLLATLGDPRTVEVAEAFDPAGIASSWEGPGLWMGERLTKLAATIRGLAKPEALTPEHRAMIEAISALLPRDASSNSELSAAAQLEHVLRHPDDDDARLVLADALQEAGDPRGELITLQDLAESSTLNSEQRKRVKQILSKHVDDLLGPLAPIVMKRGQVFRRGFLHACELKENIHATQLEAVRDSDLLATIHTVRAPIDFILLPGLRSLRDAAVIGSSQPIERLLLHETPLPFESVELTVYEDEVELLDRCTCLPELKKLSVDGPEDAIVAAAATRLARGVEWLHLCGFATGRFGDSVRQILSARGTRVSMVSTHGSDSAPGDYRFDLQVKRARPPEVAIELSLPSAGWDGSMTRCLRDLGTSLGSLRPLGARSVTVRLLKKIGDEGTRKRLLHVLRSNVADPDSLVISP